jgi:hypothetical protein
VIGGASLFGGRGSIIGTLLGGFILVFIRNGLNLMNVSPYWHGMAIGAIIIAAVLVERLLSGGRRRLTYLPGRPALTLLDPPSNNCVKCRRDRGSIVMAGEGSPEQRSAPQPPPAPPRSASAGWQRTPRRRHPVTS